MQVLQRTSQDVAHPLLRTRLPTSTADGKSIRWRSLVAPLEPVGQEDAKGANESGVRTSRPKHEEN